MNDLLERLMIPRHSNKALASTTGAFDRQPREIIVS